MMHLTTSIITLFLLKNFMSVESLSIRHLENSYEYQLNVSQIQHSVDERFLSFSIDSACVRKGFENPSLSDPRLIRLLSYLSPGYLRIGGTDADRLIFKMDNDISNHVYLLNPNDTFYMTEGQWKNINNFAKKTGFNVMFDLNVLLRKKSVWDISNAKSLVDFSTNHNYDIVWQLGNEPNSFLDTFNLTLSPARLTWDFSSLRELLPSAMLVGPDITSPHLHSNLSLLGMAPERYLKKFVDAGGSLLVDALTWHHYNLHKDAVAADFLTPAAFDSFLKAIDAVKEAVKGSEKPIWITESGSASSGGVSNASDRFIASFLFVDRLGLAAQEGLSLVIRHSLYRANYALVDRHMLMPNPDWWISLLYKRLVGRGVLLMQPLFPQSPTPTSPPFHRSPNISNSHSLPSKLSSNPTPTVLTLPTFNSSFTPSLHLASPSLSNPPPASPSLSNPPPASSFLSTQTPNSFQHLSLPPLHTLPIPNSTSIPYTWVRAYAHCSHDDTVVVFGLNFGNSSAQLIIRSEEIGESTAQLYLLTAENLLSRQVLLNGKILELPEEGAPLLESVTLGPKTPLWLPAHSIFFLHLNKLHAKACAKAGTNM